MISNYTTLLKELEKGVVQPCYLFMGTEDYLIDQAIEKLKSKALEPGTQDFNWSQFRADDDGMNWQAFADTLDSLPLIPARRVVVLKSVSKALKTAGVTSLLERTIRRASSDLTLVLIEISTELKSAALKRLAESCYTIEFDALKPPELEQYLRKFAASFQKIITAETLAQILADTNPNLRSLLIKLETLIFFVGDKETLEATDVEQCTVFSREVEVFKLLHAIGVKDVATSRFLLQQLTLRRTEIGYFVHLLYRQLWALYRMKYLQEQKVPYAQWQERLEIHPPFLLNRYRQYLPNYNMREIGSALEALTEFDLARKSSSVQDDILLWTFWEKLLHKSAEQRQQAQQ
ncbi:MAG: DNA polymerase III subunit delta [bacterium]